jgi:hypothetical protein
MACQPKLAARNSCGERRLERETGIEPATNSLEGCDSTTELLPPTRSLTSLFRATPGKPAAYRPPHCTEQLVPDFPRRGGPANRSSRSVHLRPSGYGGQPPPERERRLVAREGLEPSKPLGRQIYSLLRLTASLPRQSSVVWKPCFWSNLKDRENSVDGAGEGI